MLLSKEIFVKIVIILREVKKLDIKAIKLFEYANNQLYTLISKIDTRNLLKNYK